MIEIYQKYLSGLKESGKDQWKTLCPFHKEDTPSFGINSITGQYYCFGCGASGNIYTFLDRINHPEEKQFINLNHKIEDEVFNFIEPISPKVIEQLHKNLLNDYDKLQYLLRERRLSYFIIKKYLIGWDTRSERYSIPIKSRTGKFVNIKLHNSFKQPKAIHWQSGSSRLYPFTSLAKNQIIICEGEFDCLALHSLAINAITSTTGANKWNTSWNHFFYQKEVIIIYDNDEAGEKGSIDVLNSIGTFCKLVSNIRFPETFSGSDVTEYLKQGNDIYKLLGLKRIK